MFDMAEFAKASLIRGYQNKSFNETQISIFAMNYLSRGVITQDDFIFILESMQPKEEIEEEIED